MVEFKHEVDWYSDRCRWCGVRWTDVEDNRASPNCDIVRHRAGVRTAVIVAIGVIFCAIPIIGLVFH